MPEHVACLRPGHLVSLVPPEEQPPTPPQVRSALHLRLGINDISEPQPGQILPTMGHVERLVAFLRDWSDDRDLLLHCVAGISRSMAAALIAMALASRGREIEAATCIRASAPHARPNARLVTLADQLLSSGGRLLAGLDAMGPAELCVTGPLVRLPRYV